MRVLIIEDEPQAVLRLEKLVSALMPGVELLPAQDSVKQSVAFLSNHPAPDLILMDIQLADGLSFSIFDQVEVTSPVIFITAYDAYALKAFKVNSIDYILKPVDEDELSRAIDKFRQRVQTVPSSIILKQVEAAMQMLSRRFKERFVIRIGEHLKTVATSDILYFFSQDKATFAQTGDNRSYIVDYTLEQLENLLDPSSFFRINRKYIIQLNSIQDVSTHSNSRLRIQLKASSADDAIVAREKVDAFKSWLDR